MDKTEAMRLINAVQYKPGWEISAPETWMQAMYSGAVVVNIKWTARDTNREYAIQGYPVSKAMEVDDLIPFDCTREELLRRVFELIMELELHESREFFRVAPTYEAPFHPHRPECEEAWTRTQNQALPV